MKTKILSGILLLAMVAVGLFLPSITSGIQDFLSGNVVEQYDLPDVQAKYNGNSQSEGEPPSALTALMILNGEYMGVRYANSGEADYEAISAQAISALTELLSKIGLSEGETFTMIAIEPLLIATSVNNPSLSATLMDYHGQSENGDDLRMTIDLGSGKMVRCTYSRDISQSVYADVGNVASEIFWDMCATYYAEYYGLTAASRTAGHSLRGTISFSGRDGYAVDVPIMVLLESGTSDSKIRYTYKFN